MRLTKSKRFWVTTAIIAAIVPSVYFAIVRDMPQVAVTALFGIFASQGIYVHQETKNPSKKPDAQLDKEQ